MTEKTHRLSDEQRAHERDMVRMQFPQPEVLATFDRVVAALGDEPAGLKCVILTMLLAATLEEAPREVVAAAVGTLATVNPRDRGLQRSFFGSLCRLVGAQWVPDTTRGVM